MKVLIPVINNPVYSQLIFSLSKNQDKRQQEIADDLDKAQATIQRQLMYLVKIKFLNLEEHPEKKKNIKIFSVNWEKVNQEFIKFLLTKSKNPDFKIPERYIKNKFLSLYFEKIFASHKEVQAKTIRDIFEQLSISIMDSIVSFDEKSKPKELGEFYEFLELINSSNWESQNFLSKSEEIMDDFARKSGHSLFKDLPEEEQERYNKIDIGINDFKVAKSTENNINKSGNTNQNKPSTSENKQGVSSK